MVFEPLEFDCIAILILLVYAPVDLYVQQRSQLSLKALQCNERQAWRWVPIINVTIPDARFCIQISQYR